MLRGYTRVLLCGGVPVKMSFNEVTNHLERMPGWSHEPEPARACIKKTFLFSDFQNAWGFMESCTGHINHADHHPEWFNVYNRVEVTLATHDCGGVSEKDLTLARHMDSVAEGFTREIKQ